VLVTFRFVEAVIEPDVACTVVVPTPTLVAKPVLLIVATVVTVEAQLTEEVRFTVLPSL
jgi:hypothetical protein